MPIYEYACEQCHVKEEFMQKIDEQAPDICPNCNAKGALKKVVTTSSFQLKGGGWYKDLYASNKPAAESTSSTKTAEVKETKAVEKPNKKED